MRAEYLEVNGIKYFLKIHHENRRSSRVSIRKNNINIRIPIFLNRDEMLKEAIRMKNWAINKIKENPDKFVSPNDRQYKNGDLLKVGNETYLINLKLKDRQSSHAKIIGNAINLSMSANLPKEKQNYYISALISKCIAAKRLPTIQEKINELNIKYFNQKINKIFFKNNTSNWGSCSKKGNINISTRLLFAPADVVEYVCIHELAHLIEHNHSENFWKLVEEAMPDYKEKERWLKENGKVCNF